MTFEKFQKFLGEEKAKLEKELSLIATKNPKNPKDWEPKAPDMNPMTSDPSEMADVFEEMESQANLEWELEERLKKVNAALERLKEGTFGTCVVGGEKMDEDRLEANPLAENCVEHTKA